MHDATATILVYKGEASSEYDATSEEQDPPK